ncbi:MAG: hypothetical protein AAFR52_17620 [Pseudomonadota bacterium]
MLKLFFSVAAATSLLTASAGAVTLSFEGNIDAVPNGLDETSPEVDFFPFTVIEPGPVTFTVDASGVGFMSSILDSFVIVAVDDGDRTEDDIVGFDDDSGPGFDSFLSLNLPVGMYIAGVSTCCISPGEFVFGVNQSVSASGDENFAYRLTIDGGIAGVPIPASGVLLATPLLLAGVYAAHRRRRLRRTA